MRNKFTLSLFCLFCVLCLLPGLAVAQQGNGGVDAVGISSKYYNSIVKVLLYDSATGRINPEKAYLGRGSGFFVSEDGYIFTNRHVISMTYNGFCRYQTYNEEDKTYADNVEVYNPYLLVDPNVYKITAVGRAAIIVQVYSNAKGDSSKLYHATVVALDTANFDGAILKINSDLSGRPVTDKFHVLPIGNSDSVKQGQDLCLFGFPAQYGGTFDVMLKDLSTLIFGKHSGYDYTYNTQFGFIKTDASINSGNSGGPVFGPSNTVIGIATAAFEKTNVGLIGPVDAMYYVSALIPELQKQVTSNGLTAPMHPPAAGISATLYHPVPLPTQKDIKHSNGMAGKKGRASSKAIGVLYLTYGLSGTNNYKVNDYLGTVTNPPGTVYTTNGGGTYKVQSTEFGFGVRIIKPTFLKQKNNLIGYYLNICPSVIVANWQPVNAFQAKSAGTAIKMNPSDITNSEPNAYISFGFSYTYLFMTNVSLSAYYGVGVDIAPLNQLTIGSSQSVSTKDILYQRDIADFCQSAGVYFRYKAGFLGFDYRFGENIGVKYLLPDSFGNSSTQYSVPGKSIRSLFSIFLGVNI